MAQPKIFKDPIHGQIRYENVDLEKAFPAGDDNDNQLSWLIRKLVETPCFQRLRHIRQNGLANYVFHGAEHSRFGHSMGVAFLARKMYDRIIRNGNLEPDSRQRLATCVAALLHDVGHGPFSHALEGALSKLGVEFHHEEMTVRYILEDSPIHSVLREVDPLFPGEVAKYINKIGRDEHWSYKIVSSQLDADRLDYLLRDASFAGLKGHGFDIERLLDMLRPHAGQNIAVDRKAIEAVEAYLIMLDQMYRAVYFHHAVRAASVLLDCILQRAFDLYRDDRSDVFPTFGDEVSMPLLSLLDQGEHIPLEEYTRLSEFQIWYLIEFWSASSTDSILRDLSARLLSRRLFKTETIDSRHYDRVKTREAKACELTVEQFQDLSKEEANKYYVVVDEQNRTSYKLYDWSPAKPAESIWLVGGSKKRFPLNRTRTAILSGR